LAKKAQNDLKMPVKNYTQIFVERVQKIGSSIDF
jgi:hypothetical protein